MRLLEVYVQGVSVFLSPFRFALEGGYNVVYGGNETGKTALSKTIASTFDVEYAAGSAERLQPVIPQETAGRYGVLFEHEGTTYRLLRSPAGGVNLARQNEDTQKFQPVERDEAGLSAFLQDTLDFPMDGQFPLLGLVDGGLRVSSGPTHTPSMSAAPALFDDDANSEPDMGVEEQIRLLERQLSILGSVDEIEYRMDGLQVKKFETEAALDKFKTLGKEEARIDARIEALSALEEAPAELEDRIKNFDQQEKFKQQKLFALDKDIEILEKELDQVEPRMQKKFQKDPLFIGGAVVALLGFVLPFVVEIHVLSLLGFAGVGWLLYLFLYAYPKVSSQFKDVDTRYKAKCKEEERTKREFEEQARIIKDLVHGLQLLDEKDLLKVLTEYRSLKERKVAIASEREALSENGDENKLEKDLERQLAEISLFEEELQNAGAITQDANQIKQELDRLIALRDSGGSAVMAGAASAGSVPQVDDSGDGVVALLEAAATVARRDLDLFTSMVNEKFNAYLKALNPGKFEPVDLHPQEPLRLRRADFAGKEVRLHELSSGMRTGVELALHFAVLEVVLSSRSFPVVVDDPFGALDDRRRVVAGKILKRLSSLTQVIHFTPQKSFIQLADHHVELG